MKKNLPIFSVIGSLQELIEVEMILIMLGYDVPDETWNNNQVEDKIFTPKSIKLFKFKCLLYLALEFECDENPRIKATDIEGIIKYVTNYKK